MKKVLIKASSNPEELICSYPLLHILKEKYGADEINLIVEGDYKDLLEGLPFETRVWDLPEEKKSFLGIHHWAYNLIDVFNINLSIDLENSLKSSFVNFCFKSETRLGNRKGFMKFLNNHKLPKEFESKKEKMGVDFLESFLEEDFTEFRISNQYKKVDILEYPYVVLHMENLDDDWPLWLDVLDSFEGQNFIIWTSVEKEKAEELFQNLSKKNTYAVKEKGSIADLGLLLENSKGLISNEAWSIQFSNYLNISSVFLGSLPIINSPFFKAIPLQILKEEDNFLIKQGLKEERDQVFDHAVSQIAEFLALE